MWITLSLAAAALLESGLGSVPEFEKGFLCPPMSARPQAWWHWMNGNITREGIVADLEAMAQMGLGGATLFDAGCGVPNGGMLDFASSNWFDTVQFAVSEAHRRGLEIVTPTCSGWSSSGGPWVTPEKSMKVLCHTEARVQGPDAVEVTLPPLPDPHGYSADIAVLAVPVPPAENDTMEKAGVEISEPATNVTVFSFPTPFAASGLFFRLEHPWAWEVDGTVTVETSDDGVRFSRLCSADANVARRADADRTRRYVPFPRSCTARAYRVSFRFDTKAADPHDAEVIKTVRARDLRIGRAAAIADLADKSLAKRMTVSRAPEAEPTAVVAKADVRDVTAQFGKDGVLRWNAPAGAWRIIRLGYAVNGRKNHPASEHGEGPEVDKLAPGALAEHFDAYTGKLKGVASVLVDSYEIGCQNWTPGFEREFARRRGYSMVPYLPVLAGVIVGSVDESERFLWDFRRTVADLFAENYSGALASRCHEKGWTLSLEPYGNCPCDDLEYGDAADIPMGEFWSRADLGDRYLDVGNAKLPSYLAHVWGRRYVGAEAFTTSDGRWRTTPFALKAQGDRAFSCGVNRLIFHCSTHQPWTKCPRMPGATLGPYGMYLNRAQTWWHQARPWMDYLARCQWMLQEGTFVADVLFWHGEEAPSRGGHLVGFPADFADTPVPDGYDRDVCSTKALLRLRVEDGKIVAPGGTRYALLVLQDTDEMSDEVLSAVGRLVSAGAHVAAPRRPTRHPGLRDYPQADARIRERASAVWTKGVVTGAAAEGLAACGVPPDFICRSAPDGLVRETTWIHRIYPKGVHAYFVACPNEHAGTCTASFRVDGFEPEIWDAEKGCIGLKPRAWKRVSGRTEVSFDLPPSGSAFVVFRRPVTAVSGGAGAVARQPRSGQTLDGPWKLSFPVGWYFGRDDVRTMTVDRLCDWTALADPDFKYFSGTVTYEAEWKVPKRAAGERLILNLGEVKNFAEVSVNGRAYPTLWRPPFELDVTEAAGTADVLKLTVRVTNLWPNRLIGDDRLYPPDCEWEGSALKRMPDWVWTDKPNPTGRHTFSTWRHWTKDDKLLPSGLLGPVRLLISSVAAHGGSREGNI